MILHVIDGNSLLFRAYFATYFTGNIMRTKDGFPTNAIYGFNNMITKILSTLDEEDKIIVCFDTGKKTFRHQEYNDYKAQRKQTDQDLLLQIPLARTLLNNLGVTYYEQEGFEADDIAGSIAKQASKKHIKTYCYTSDKDYLQLIDDFISIKMIKKGLTDIEEINEETLKEKMNLTPKQIIDYKGLMGDPSDNLKGIPGIGEKTAIKLLNQYQNLEKIIEEMKSQNSKLAQKIVENQDQGLLCKKLATIVTNMSLPFTIDDLSYKGYDYNQLSSFYTQYEFFSLLKKLKPNKCNKKSDDDNLPNFKCISVNNFKEIKNPKIFIVDIEKGNYHNASVNGIYFSNKDQVYFFSKSLFNDQDFIDFMSDNKKAKITYDFKMVKVSLNNYNIKVEGLVFDLLLATYLIDPSIISDPINVYGYYNINLLIQSSLSIIEESYYDKMAYYLEQIYQKVESKLKELNLFQLYNQIELPLTSILADMEIEGIPLNLNVLKDINQNYLSRLNEIQNRIYELAGYEFNIASPKQVADLLFNKLKLPSNKKQSTSIDVLNYLKDYHPIVKLLIDHRKYAKIISTYSQGLANYVYPDGKIHTIFNQALTQTGRLSSSEPNLQNISTRSEEGKAIRKAFFYENEYLLSLDYSQVELRVLASMSSCSELIEIFNNDGDIHSATAIKVFNVESNQLTSELRRKAKAVNFGIVYGISDWGLAEQISSTPQEAKQIIDSFYQHYPEIKEYFAKTIEKAKEDGYSLTLYNRRRYIPELNSDNYQTREFGKRVAMNAPIQGTAADIMKICMIKVSEFLKSNNYKTKIVLQIHDELIFKVPEEEKDFMPQKLKHIMENCVSDLSVKLKVDGSLAKTWYDCK